MLLPCANPASARALEELGATPVNVATDLSPAELGELRAACSAPLDVYVEAPDDQGGFVRFYEVAEIIRLAAPVYVKLGLRNAPNIYPAGLHLDELAVKLGRERVRRAELVLRLLEERAPDLSRVVAATARPTSGFPNREGAVLGISAVMGIGASRFPLLASRHGIPGGGGVVVRAVCELLDLAAAELDREDRARLLVGDLRAVGRPGGLEVVARGRRHPAQALAVETDREELVRLVALRVRREDDPVASRATTRG